jgi:DNA-binding HxlR family transcriptional regulator
MARATGEYSLTAAGRSLTEPLDAIRRRAERHIEEVLAARRKRDSRRPPART